MRTIGGWIADVLQNPLDYDQTARVEGSVRELCAEFPLYPELKSA